MAEVASAFVSLMFSAKGATEQLDREVVGAGTKAGRRGGAEAGRSFHKGFTPGIKSVIGAIGGIAVAGKAVSFLKDSVGEAREAQKVGAQTNAVIQSTGGAAKVSAKHVGDLATAISNKAGVDDEAIQQGANLLLTFKNVKNEAGKGNAVFDRTTQVMTDMSAAMGKSPKASAIALGKALNDPVKGMTALSKVGVTFTAQQKLTNKALVEGGDQNAAMATGLVGSTQEWNAALKQNKGDVAATVKSLTSELTPAQKKYYDHLAEGGHTVEAQKTILKELNSEFHGSAAATATAGEKAQVAFGNLKESVGTAMLPVIDKVANTLTSKVIPAVQGFITGLQDGTGAGGKVRHAIELVVDKVKEFVGQMRDGTGPGGKLADVLGRIRDGFKNAWPHVKQLLGFLSRNKTTVAAFVGAIGALVVGMKIWHGVTKAMAVIQAILNGELVLNPIGLIVVAIAALVAGLVYAYRHSEKFHDAVNKVWSVTKKVGAFLGKVFVGYLTIMAKAWLTMAIFAVKAVGSLVKAVMWAFGKILDAAAKGLGWIPGIGGKIKGARDSFHQFATKTGKGLDAVADKLKGVRDGIGKVKSKKVTVDVKTKFHYTGNPKYAATAKVYQAQATAKHAEIDGQRAAGGPVGKGKLYLVGERGPELFRAPMNGTIVPNGGVRGGLNGPQFYVERVEAQDVNHFLREMQHRGRATAGGGVSF